MPKKHVFFSNLSRLDFPEEMSSLEDILTMFQVPFGYLKATKDYFCRDYMPVEYQPGKLVGFTFNPDYLDTPTKRKYITNQQIVLEKNEIGPDNIINSPIVLDGGNVIMQGNKAIISDKVLRDNPATPQSQLCQQLGHLLQKEIIIIPSFPQEETGHADGLVRFIDDTTVLTYNLDCETIPWKDDFIGALGKHNLTVRMLPAVSKYDDFRNWAYLNYLHLPEYALIILPLFGRKSDTVMTDFFRDMFPDYHIHTVTASSFLREGGVLNCISWDVSL